MQLIASLLLCVSLTVSFQQCALAQAESTQRADAMVEQVDAQTPSYLKQTTVGEADTKTEIQSTVNDYLKRTAKYRANTTYESTERVVNGTDVSAVSTDAAAPLKGPCSNTRPPGSQPDLIGQAFYRAHPDAFKSVVAVVVWKSGVKAWALVGTGGLVAPTKIVSAAHVFRAAFDLSPPDHNGIAATIHDGYLVFNVFYEKFNGPIPDTYAFQNDPDAVFVPAGSTVKLPSNGLIDVAVLSIAPQPTRAQVHLATTPLAEGTPLAVIGVPGPPQSEDATDFRVIQDFAVCGYDSEDWPVTMRLGTGTYVGIDSPSLDTIDFAVSTVGGMSGGVILQQSDASLVAVVAGTKPDPVVTSNVGYGSKVLASLLSP